MSRVPMLIVTLVFIACLIRPVWADTALYQYEGDVLPYDESAGWIIANACDGNCVESMENGYYVTEQVGLGNPAYNHHLWIDFSGDPPPPASLWVEWRFHSNQPLPPYALWCDAEFKVFYGKCSETVSIFSDAAFDFSGCHGIVGLDADAFHTYRFESLDGLSYTVAVDGIVFIESQGNDIPGATFLQLRRAWGCGSQYLPVFNEWDYVRYGEIGFGERIVATEPPMGWLNAQQHSGLDRFAVTFDSPNYAYLDNISVEVTPGPNVAETIEPPVATKTWRRKNDGPETLEIVLDRPLPTDAHTRFIFDDGGCDDGDPKTECHKPIIDYSFIPGDASGNGRIDLADFAALQNCFGEVNPAGTCRAVELAGLNEINLLDYELLFSWWGGP